MSDSNHFLSESIVTGNPARKTKSKREKIAPIQVPFLDLNAHHEPLRAEFSRAIEEVIDCGAFAGGRFVEAFEKDFAEYCMADQAIGVASGTDALLLVLKGLNVGPGDEVITVPGTFFATAEAISLCGAKPVFVDINEETCNLDPAGLEKAVTPRTKAIIPVHLFGQPADMNPILKFARDRGIAVVEDSCQAHGAEYEGRRTGSLADAGCFSFYPGKNLGAFGEGGAVVTNNLELTQRIWMLRDHGQSQKYHHRLVGWNARMDGIQAAVLQIKLRHLDAKNDQRIANAKRYQTLLADVGGVSLPVCLPQVRHVYHIFAVMVENRDEVMKFLTDRGVGCGIHYPVPVHLQEAYRSLGHGPGSFPVAERCSSRLLSLPMFPELTNRQIDYVAEVLSEAVCR